MRLNCWEFKNCGRQPGGPRAQELGICPVTTHGNLAGVHGGTNAGRACWVVAGTLCRGRVQGTFAKKYVDCIFCDFYKDVKQQEAQAFHHPMILLERLMGY